MASTAPAKQTASNLVAAYAAHIKGKVVLTTGVSPSGLGAHFVKVLAAGGLPSLLILAGRNLAKVQETAKEIASAAAAGEGGEGAGEGGGVQVRVLELDLTSMDAVRAAADTVNKWTDVPQIDVLVNNAGVMGTEWSRTPEGFENQLATNHLGPFLFTNLIMSKLTKSPAPRVVTISSEGHRMSPIRFADPNFQDGALYNKWQAYGQSKTANILFGVELARRLGAKNHLSAFSVSPGAVKTKLSSHLDWSKEFAAASAIDKFFGNDQMFAKAIPYSTIDEGVATFVYAAFDPEVTAHNGSYLVDCHPADPWKDTIKAWATDPVEAQRLWKLSEKLLGQEFTY